MTRPRCSRSDGKLEATYSQPGVYGTTMGCEMSGDNLLEIGEQCRGACVLIPFAGDSTEVP